MKNKLKLIGFIVCLISGICFWTNQNKEIPFLLLENVEALAYGEHGNRVYCYGYGSVDCGGEWYEMRIEGLSLE